MRFVFLFFGLLLVVAFQVAAWPDVTLRIMPNFVLAVCLGWLFATGARSGAAAMLIAGLTLDLYSQRMFGRFLVGFLLGYALVMLMTRGAAEGISYPYRLVAGSIAIIACELWILIYMNIAVPRMPFFAQLADTATLNILATIVFFAIITPLVDVIARSIAKPYERSL
jgi:cell shape-determining protein MreD